MQGIKMMSMKSAFFLVLIGSMIILELTSEVDAGCNTKGCCNCSRQTSGKCEHTGPKLCISGGKDTKQEGQITEPYMTALIS